MLVHFFKENGQIQASDKKPETGIKVLFSGKTADKIRIIRLAFLIWLKNDPSMKFLQIAPAEISAMVADLEDYFCRDSN